MQWKHFHGKLSNCHLSGFWNGDLRSIIRASCTELQSPQVIRKENCLCWDLSLSFPATIKLEIVFNPLEVFTGLKYIIWSIKSAIQSVVSTFLLCSTSPLQMLMLASQTSSSALSCGRQPRVLWGWKYFSKYLIFNITYDRVRELAQSRSLVTVYAIFDIMYNVYVYCI